MDLRRGRQAVRKALTDAGVEFPEFATLKQLKKLYVSLNFGEDWKDDTTASAPYRPEAAGYDCNGKKEFAVMPATSPAAVNVPADTIPSDAGAVVTMPYVAVPDATVPVVPSPSATNPVVPVPAVNVSTDTIFLTLCPPLRCLLLLCLPSLFRPLSCLPSLYPLPLCIM